MTNNHKVNKERVVKVSRIIEVSDAIKKKNYESIKMLKEANEHKEFMHGLQNQNQGINLLLGRLGLRD